MYKRADKKLNPVSRWVASTTETSECSNLTGEVVKLEMLNRPQQQQRQQQQSLLVLVLARRRLGRCVASCWSGACCITLPPAVAYLAALLLWLNWYLTLAGRWVVGWLAGWLVGGIEKCNIVCDFFAAAGCCCCSLSRYWRFNVSIGWCGAILTPTTTAPVLSLLFNSDQPQQQKFCVFAAAAASWLLNLSCGRRCTFLL